MERSCFCYAGSPLQAGLWSFPPCFHLRGYFQNENDACRLFYPRSKKRHLCQNQQRVSKPSRFPKTQRLTQSCDSWSGSSKPGTPYLLSYLGCGNKRWGGAGACWWKSRGKVKYYDSFHFLGRGLENSHPFLRPSLLANGAVLVWEACEYCCRFIDSCTVNQSLCELFMWKALD